jgi:hypothetical protein
VPVGLAEGAYPLRGSLLDNWKRRAYSDPEDPKKDGSRKSNALWAKRGLASGLLSVCNTWVAPAREVS